MSEPPRARDALIADIGARLREMSTSEAKESRLVLRLGDAWLVVIREAGSRTWRVEAPASHRLPARLRLTQERGQALRLRGFAKQRGGKGDFVRHTEAAEETTLLRTLPDELLEVFASVYASPVGADGAAVDASLVHDDRYHPQNPELIEAMRLASQRKDQVGRMALYNAMANATFVVPVDSSEAPAWMVAEEQEAGPIYDLFTDWPNFRISFPLEHRYEAVHGADLFVRAQALGALSLNFNPFGAVGGQLYAVEIANMVTAIRRWKAKHAN